MNAITVTAEPCATDPTRAAALALDENPGTYYVVREWMTSGGFALRGSCLSVFAAIWGVSTYSEEQSFLGGVPALTRMCGISESSAKRAICTLRESGLILQGEWRDYEGRLRLNLAPDYEAVMRALQPAQSQKKRRPPRSAGDGTAAPSNRVTDFDRQGTARHPTLHDAHSSTCGPSSEDLHDENPCLSPISSDTGIRKPVLLEIRAGVQNEPHTPSKMTPVTYEDLTTGLTVEKQQLARDVEKSDVENSSSDQPVALPKAPSNQTRRLMTLGNPADRSIRPTLEQVRQYAAELCVEVDCEAFMAENDSRGWLDSVGLPIRSWRSWFAAWVRNELRDGGAAPLSGTLLSGRGKVRGAEAVVRAEKLGVSVKATPTDDNCLSGSRSEDDDELAGIIVEREADRAPEDDGRRLAPDDVVRICGLMSQLDFAGALAALGAAMDSGEVDPHEWQ